MGCNYLLKSPPKPSWLSEPIFLIFCCIALLLLISRRKIHIATINISHRFLFVEPFMKTWCMKLYSMSLLYYNVFIRLQVKIFSNEVRRTTNLYLWKVRNKFSIHMYEKWSNHKKQTFSFLFNEKRKLFQSLKEVVLIKNVDKFMFHAIFFVYTFFVWNERRWLMNFFYRTTHRLDIALFWCWGFICSE